MSNKNDIAFLLDKPIAHRGLWNKEYPENSLPAFENAVKKGFPIEIDIQLSSDKEIVVFHDDTLNRMTNLKGSVNLQSFKTLNSTKLLNTEYTIPSLREVLKLVDAKVPLLIEIKSSKRYDSINELTIEALKNYKGKFAIQSFNPYCLRSFKTLAPDIIRGQLATFDYDNIAKFKAYLLKRMVFNNKTQPHFISYNCKNLPNRFVDKCKDTCQGVLAWTVTSKTEQQRLKPYADNIIFDSFIPE